MVSRRRRRGRPKSAPARPARARDRATGRDSVQAALEQRFVVREPERRLRIGRAPGPCEAGVRRSHARGQAARVAPPRAAARALRWLRSASITSGTKSRWPSQEAGERHVDGHRGPRDQRVGVGERGDVVGGAHERPWASAWAASATGTHRTSGSLPLPGRLGRRRVVTREVGERRRRLGFESRGPARWRSTQRCASSCRSRRPAASSSARMRASARPPSGPGPRARAHAPPRARRGRRRRGRRAAALTWTRRSSRAFRPGGGPHPAHVILGSPLHAHPSRDRTKEQARGQRYAHDHGQPHRQQLRGADRRTTPSRPRISDRSRSPTTTSG